MKLYLSPPSDFGMTVYKFNENVCTGSADIYHEADSEGFLSEIGTMYYMLVFNLKRFAVGDFIVGLTKSTLECETAMPIEFETALYGNTMVGAANQWNSGKNFCGIGTKTRAVWYSYRRFDKDRLLTVTTCTNDPNDRDHVDTRISVFTIDEEDCSGQYTCVDSNESSELCDKGASVTWTARRGENYVIAVSSLEDDLGSFAVVLHGEE